MTLEQQLFALLETHGLSSVSVHVAKRPDGTSYVYAAAHADGRCAFSTLADRDNATVNQSLGSAIGELSAKRYPQTVEVEPFAAMGDAA